MTTMQVDTALVDVSCAPLIGPDLSNGDLVLAARAGDRSAWEELVSRHTGLLWAVARDLRLSPADAADAVQMTWLRLLEHIGDIRDPERVSGWLAVTVRREGLACVRRFRREAPLADEIVASIPDPADAVDTGLLRREASSTMQHALAQLPAKQQLLLRLLSTDPAPSYADISELLEMPVGSIGPTRARALERLRAVLEGQTV